MITDEQQLLVESHIYVVKALASQLLKRLGDHVQFEDAFQDGCIGLIEAASRYDLSSGVRFSTYAKHRIWGAMVDGLRRWSFFKSLYRYGEIDPDAFDIIENTYLQTHDRDVDWVIDLEMADGILSSREYDIIIRYYILGDLLEEIGRDYNICESGVLYARDRAINKLKGHYGRKRPAN